MRWSRRLCPLVGLVAWIAAGEAARGFAQQDNPASLNQPPRVFGDYTDLWRQDWSMPDAGQTPSSTPRLQFFRMPSDSTATPLGVYPIGDRPADDDKSAVTSDDLSFMQVTFGAHIPYLDMYRPGDPGGFGYYKLQSKVQIFDIGSTSVSAVVQAVTPMGLQNGGVSSGTTVVSPSLACFQDLGEGTALHAFIGQDLATNANVRDQLQAGFRCGVALQQPIPLTAATGDQGLYLFVEALGQYRADSYNLDGKTASWDVIPGVQYRLGNACWMSLGISHYSFFSCKWQY